MYSRNECHFKEKNCKCVFPDSFSSDKIGGILTIVIFLIWFDEGCQHLECIYNLVNRYFSSDYEILKIMHG